MKSETKTPEAVAAGIFEKMGIAPDMFAANIDGLSVAGGVVRYGSVDAVPELTDFQKTRLGKITCSNFHRITYARGTDQWSDTAESYLAELVFEHDTGTPASRFSGSAATEWGNEHEETAIQEYEARTGQKVIRQQFCKLAGFRLVGGTPDAVGKKGLEVKCPYNPKNHYWTLQRRTIPKEYEMQVIGHILLTGRKACDFASFNPRSSNPHTRMVIIEKQRNEHEIEALTDKLFHFEETLFERLRLLEIEPRF